MRDWSCVKSSRISVVRIHNSDTDDVLMRIAMHSSVAHTAVTNIVCGAGVLRDGIVVKQARAKHAKIYQFKVYGVV